MFTCLNVYTYIHAHSCTFTHIQANSSTFTHIHTHSHAFTHIHAHSCTFTHIHAHHFALMTSIFHTVVLHIIFIVMTIVAM